MIEREGTYKIIFSEYLSDPVVNPSLSRSTIKDLLFNSPAHAWFNNPRLNPDYKEKENGKFDIGTAAHAMLLEGADSIVVIDAEDWRTKVAKEARDNAREEGKTPLLPHQFAEVSKMVTQAKCQILECKELHIKDLSEDGDAELTYIWQEGDTWFRTRPDWISKDKNLCIDYKTAGGSINPNEIGRHIVSMAYDIQNSLYVRGIKAIEGINPKFVFIFQSTEEPYLCSFIALSPQFIDMGNSKCDFGIWLWRKCLSSNKWPGYPSRVCWVDPPAWSLASWEIIGASIGEGEDSYEGKKINN